LGEEVEKYDQNLNLINLLNFGKTWQIIKDEDLLHK